MKSKKRFVALYRAIMAAPLFVAFVSASANGGEKVLYYFCSQQYCTDGNEPGGTLITDDAGNLYGTTAWGGGHSCDAETCGTVFKLAPDGTETVLHAFVGKDGAFPYAGLVADKAGNFYGTTSGGGTDDMGTVFKLAPDGTLTVLHKFQGGNDGAWPGYGSLLIDKKGNLYGTTEGGGVSPNCNGGCGTVFEVKPNGKETVLYAFQGGTDGTLPLAGLAAIKGNFYGTTARGGVNCDGVNYGCGTVFKVTPDGAEIVLHAFTDGSDGSQPWAGLIADGAGNLYGTTLAGGGTNCGACGTVFKLAPDGSETILHAFAGGKDGFSPEYGLVADKAGNLYGTTTDGGSKCGCGTAFGLAPDGTETVLVAFKGKNGAYPSSTLIVDKHGVLYGTATGDGPGARGGVVFSLRE